MLDETGEVQEDTSFLPGVVSTALRGRSRTRGDRHGAGSRRKSQI